MFIAELALPDFADYDLSSLRTGIMAGSPCPVEVMKQVIDKMGMTEVTIAYGMTETSPVSTQTGADDDIDRRTSTVGRTMPHLESKIIDPATGLTVPRGVPGELCTRGYSVMLGYWDQPDKTAEVIDPARWMHTSDIGVMDEDGYLTLTDRKSDIIIRGGENISALEVEEILLGLAAVAEAVVVAAPDARLGERAAAVLCIKPDHAMPTMDEVRAHFDRAGVARQKWPEELHQVDDYPRTASGKVQKYVVRQSIRDR